MGEKARKYVFGPVASRRLGLSLGVDLIPTKTCTLNCVYCQIGRTTDLRVRREEFVPMETLLAELKATLAEGVRPDYITLAGSGEPTLYGRLGELIDRIHEITTIPVDVITNGVLLSEKGVREELGRADLIVPSMDAADAATFAAINRPAEDADFEGYLDGLKAFCREHGAKVWLEILFVAGVNDSDDHVKKLAAIANELPVARVQINTAVRPPAESDVRAVSAERLQQIASQFRNAQIIAEFVNASATKTCKADPQAVLAMILRHPCTAVDVANGLNTSMAEAMAVIGELLAKNAIVEERHAEKVFYGPPRTSA